jgi:hypothetical protein
MAGLGKSSILSSTGTGGRGGGGGGTSIKAARVKGVILNDKDYPEMFEAKSKWENIGSIFFEFVDAPNRTTSLESLNLAKPMNPGQKHIPLENELVCIVTVNAGIDQEFFPGDQTFFYFSPINVWNSCHQNGIPDGTFQSNASKPLSQQQNYEQTSGGSPNVVDPKSPSIILGKTFEALDNVKNLQLYEGDIVEEGRWGHSIRFGSTVSDGKPSNPWSSQGKDGDPIIVIRNGQYEDSDDAWIPQLEDINKDKTSVYLTSTQNIPIETINNEFTSYNDAPTKPDKYAGSQVIINSDRLVFNAKTDSVLISGEKSVFLGGNGSLNLNAGQNIVVECDDIKLGDKEATEPLILGDKFLNDLSSLLQEILVLGNTLGASPIMIAPFTPSPAHIPSATAMSIRAQTMLTNIETYKSKISKTK